MNLLIGDSHMLALENYVSNTDSLHAFSAASIVGLLNINSTTRARATILDILSKQKFDQLFIMFGKVDMEWTYPYKKNRGYIDINTFINDTVEQYIKFIDQISSNFKCIYVMGLHLPCLESDAMLHCINVFKSNVENPISALADLKTRTEQILRFNKVLKPRIDMKYQYIDINDTLIDNMSGLCDSKYIISGDHHLDRDKAGKVWYDTHLKSLFERGSKGC